MHNLMKSYNRHYYWRIFCIYVNIHFKMAKLQVAGWLVRFAFWLSSDLEKRLSKGFKPRV